MKTLCISSFWEWHSSVFCTIFVEYGSIRVSFSALLWTNESIIEKNVNLYRRKIGVGGSLNLKWMVYWCSQAKRIGPIGKSLSFRLASLYWFLAKCLLLCFAYILFSVTCSYIFGNATLLHYWFYSWLGITLRDYSNVEDNNLRKNNKYDIFPSSLKCFLSINTINCIMFHLIN